jgi:gliding motility-associated-like protein
VPEENKPIQFTNLSANANNYIWNFGDGSSSTDVNPNYQYKRTGHYLVCLIARTSEGCTDTVCKYVDAEIRTAVGVPSAFSPNHDGHNDILYVRGAGIETMNLKIFDRWGKMIFESNSVNDGWDGTYKGKDQGVNIYAYLLNVTFIDGTSQQLKGNITLLR